MTLWGQTARICWNSFASIGPKIAAPVNKRDPLENINGLDYLDI